MKHPEVHAALQPETTLEDDFAERAFEILSSYQTAYRVEQDDAIVVRPITERVDIVTDDKTTLHAFRLSRLQALALSYALDAEEPDPMLETSDTHAVLSLEYGTYDNTEQEEPDYIDDEKFAWQSYVLAVINRQTEEACLLDGATGKELGAGDVVTATYNLELLRNGLRYMTYEDELLKQDEQLAITLEEEPDGRWGPFDHETVLVDNYDRHDCSGDCELNHQQTQYN